MKQTAAAAAQLQAAALHLQRMLRLHQLRCSQTHQVAAQSLFINLALALAVAEVLPCHRLAGAWGPLQQAAAAGAVLCRRFLQET
jgi:hypothetical protein